MCVFCIQISRAVQRINHPRRLNRQLHVISSALLSDELMGRKATLQVACMVHISRDSQYVRCESVCACVCVCADMCALSISSRTNDELLALLVRVRNEIEGRLVLHA